MADGLWGRQVPLYASSAGLLKRPRTDYEVGGRKARERGCQRKASSYGTGEASNLAEAALGRTLPGGMHGLSMVEPSVIGHPGAVAPDLTSNGSGVGFEGQLSVDKMGRPGCETIPLPLDASNILYFEGLLRDSTRQEVAHIFHPFVGYKEVRLVSEESKHRGGDPIILCFVDFDNLACAATAMSALQALLFTFKINSNDQPLYASWGLGTYVHASVGTLDSPSTHDTEDNSEHVTPVGRWWRRIGLEVLLL